MRFVILEGPDRCGKTTLARRMVDVGLATHVIHHGQPSDDAYQEYRQALTSPYPEGEVVVLDRFLYGELVYGPLLRRASQLTWGQVDELEQLITTAGGAAVVVCLPSRETVHRLLDGNKEPTTWTPPLVDRVYDDYEEIIKSCPLPLHRYDREDDATHEKVLGWLRQTTTTAAS